MPQTPEFAKSTLMYSDHIRIGAALKDQRTGQYMFNQLPAGPAAAVRGKLFDPFNKELTEREICAWIEDHLIFDGQRIVAVYNNNQILWEEDNATVPSN